MVPEKREKQNLFRRIGEAFSTLAAYRYTTIAGTLVFFLILSIVPFTFWLTLLFGESALGTGALADTGLFGWAEDLLRFLGENAAATTGSSILFLATTFWSVSSFFYHLRRSGEIIYAYRRKKHGWRVRLSALGLTVLVLFFFAGTGGIFVTLSLLMRGLPRLLSRTLLFVALLVFGFFAAWLLNAYVCPYRCRPADTALGSLFTALAWLAASAAFAVYAGLSDKAKLYGALSLVIVFLLWLYWMMVCFTAGVVFNCVRMKGKRLEHKKL